MTIPKLNLLIQSFIYFLLCQFSFSIASASPGIANCKDAQGLKVVIEYLPDGKPVIKKVLSPIFTEQSDESYITNIAINDLKFKNSNVEVLVDILNFEKKSLKKYVLKSWITDKDLPGLKISKINMSKFFKSKISDPYDKYANLDENLKSKKKRLSIPFDAKISIRNANQKPFCFFDYKYGSVSEY
jgi:hypothetical protein